MGLTHPGFLIAALVTAAALVVTVSFWIYDFDLWDHLVVGKSIWSHGIPTTQQWTWPLLGQPVLVPSWLFRALLWPFWEHGGVEGLFLWRWITVLGEA